MPAPFAVSPPVLEMMPLSVSVVPVATEMLELLDRLTLRLDVNVSVVERVPPARVSAPVPSPALAAISTVPEEMVVPPE